MEIVSLLFIRTFRRAINYYKINWCYIEYIASLIVQIEYRRNPAKFCCALLDAKRRQCMEINQEIDNYQLSNRLSALKARTGLAYIHENNRKSI